MATYEDFMPEIKLRAYGVSDPVVEMFVRSAAIEFCERTQLWTRQVQEFAFAGDGRISITGIDEEQEQLDGVMPGWTNGIRVSTRVPDEIGPSYNSFAAANFSVEQTGSPQYIFQLPEEPNIVGVWPIPDKQYADIIFTVILKPSTNATVLPDFLLRDYRTVIVEGALASIYEVVGQPFSDPQRAQISRTRFAGGKLDGEVDGRRGRLVNGNLTVEMRSFGFGRR